MAGKIDCEREGEMAEGRGRLFPLGNPKPKIVVVVGATGSGKSRLAIDLASYFPVEVVNADSMQVIDSILSQKHLPVIVGGTNYYIQALVSPFLLDDLMEEMDECIPGDAVSCLSSEQTCEDSTCDFDLLRKVDPASANRIHPNNIRKVKHYLSLCRKTGKLPSELFQGKGSEKRRLNRLKEVFGWELHYFDATEAILSKSAESWTKLVVEPCVETIRFFLHMVSLDESKGLHESIASSDLWTQYVCQACGNRVLRGAHEWKEHLRGRGHRKRIHSLRKKAQNFGSGEDVSEKQLENCLGSI